jgi:AraC-like DNA-binding protein
MLGSTVSGRRSRDRKGESPEAAAAVPVSMEHAPWRAHPEGILFEGGGLVLSTFDCPPEHPAWSRTNATGPWPLIAFPGTPVWIEHEGGPPFVADPTVAVLYTPGQEYRRRLLDPTGDHCTVVGMDDAILLALAQEADEQGGRAPASSRVPVSSGVRLAHRRVLWALRSDASPDPLWLQETLLLSVAATVLGALRVPSSPQRNPTRRRSTGAAARREAAEEARAILGRSFREPLTLDQVAVAVHMSPFHLARLFRAETGTTVHGYLTDLRLRAALDAMRPAGGDLARVAADAGFAHHSHLTDLFTRRFGVPPSRARDVAMSAVRNRAGS